MRAAYQAAKNAREQQPVGDASTRRARLADKMVLRHVGVPAVPIHKYKLEYWGLGDSKPRPRRRAVHLDVPRGAVVVESRRARSMNDDGAAVLSPPR